jgi:hypothetical protein
VKYSTTTLTLALSHFETVSQYRSWFENLTTNVLLNREFKQLSVRPELVEGLQKSCDTVSSRERGKDFYCGNS